MIYTDAYNEFWRDVSEGLSTEGGEVRDGIHGGLCGPPEQEEGGRERGRGAERECRLTQF